MPILPGKSTALAAVSDGCYHCCHSDKKLREKLFDLKYKALLESMNVIEIPARVAELADALDLGFKKGRF